MATNKLIEKMFYLILSGSALICSNFMMKLSSSVDTLNVNMAVVVQTIGNHDARIKSVETKLDVINERVRK